MEGQTPVSSYVIVILSGCCIIGCALQNRIFCICLSHILKFNSPIPVFRCFLRWCWSRVNGNVGSVSDHSYDLMR